MLTLTKSCLECGKPLSGRADKKFCTEMCRNVHNNRRYAYENNTIRTINRTLKKNWRILDKLCPEGRNYVGRQSLQDFNFAYFTHVHKTKTGKTCFYVYDLGYIRVKESAVLIFRSKRPIAEHH